MNTNKSSTILYLNLKPWQLLTISILLFLANYHFSPYFPRQVTDLLALFPMILLVDAIVTKIRNEERRAKQKKSKETEQ